jgi:hypothetical protein
MYVGAMTRSYEPKEGLGSAFSFLTKIKYGGIIGKVAAVGIVFFLTLCCLTFAARASQILLGAILGVAVLGLVFLVSRIEAIFRSNPEMSTLEGKEIIEYQQVTLHSKNHEPKRVVEVTKDPELPSPAAGQLLDDEIQSEEEL